MEIAHYLTADGHDPVQDWMDAVRDMRARVAILRPT
jgi:putative component of toxin-antitoxin plasmid stabilization module